MTREKAIRHGKEQLEIFGEGCEHYEFIKMAIQALSQELCEWGKMTFDAISGMSIFEFSDGTVKRVKQAELEPCEDAISRDAVIKIIEDAETARLRGDIDLLYAPILKKLNELTSVNPQPCDDAISRILKRMWNCRGKHTTSIDKVAMEQIIRDELPSVTQKSGKWILTIEDWNKWACSNCGYVKRTDIHVNIGWKYCPNCGSAMKGE